MTEQQHQNLLDALSMVERTSKGLQNTMKTDLTQLHDAEQSAIMKNALRNYHKAIGHANLVLNTITTRQNNGVKND